jgi:hypothetical protein
VIDLKRWGLVTTAILAVGFSAGRCSAFTGPFSRLSELKVDSIRIADAAKAKAEARSQDSFQAIRNGFEEQLAIAQSAQVVRVVRTEVATDSFQHALAALRTATANLPALRTLVDVAQARADSLAAAQGRERLGAAAAARAADSIIRADTRELARDTSTIASLQKDVRDGLNREAQLARVQGGGWTVTWALGPGFSADRTGLRTAPVQLTVGISHSIKIPLPRLFNL